MKVSVKDLLESRDAMDAVCSSPEFPTLLGFKLGVLRRKGIAPILAELEEKRQGILKGLADMKLASEETKTEQWKTDYKDLETRMNIEWDALLSAEEEIHDVQIPLSALSGVTMSPAMLGTLDWLIVDDTEKKADGDSISS